MIKSTIVCWTSIIVYYITSCYGQDCRDSIATTTCHFISRMGQCPQYSKVCASTCGFCNTWSSPNVWITDTTWRPNTPAWRRVTTAPRTTAKPCVDLSATCGSIAAASLCHANDLIINNCRKSCGACTPSAPAVTRRPPISRNPWIVTTASTTQSPKRPRAKWGVWGPFGTCSKQCGYGTHQRTRQCSVPRRCKGLNFQPRACNTFPCLVTTTRTTTTTRPTTTAPRTTARTTKQPARGQWMRWGSYGKCSKSCGRGTHRRTRQCSIPGTCKGRNYSIKFCNAKRCPVTTMRAPTTTSRTTQTTARKTTTTTTLKPTTTPPTTTQRATTTTTKPTTATVKVTPVIQKEHRTTTKKIRPTKRTPPVSQWSRYSACSVTCGNGFKTRKRVCNVEDCTMKLEQKAKCTMKKCPSWQPWSPWSKCAVSCGTGSQLRKRICRPLNSNCVGNSTMIRSCKVACPEWSSWSSWTVCSRTCGSAVKRRERFCSSMKLPCKGEKREVAKCNLLECSVKARPQLWEECSKTCGTGTQYRFKNSSCTDKTNTDCLREYMHCNTMACPKAECEFGSSTRQGIPHSCCKMADTYSPGSCGSNIASSRILNGVASLKNQWPWMVYLELDIHLCGATIINKEWLITAGHCAYDIRHKKIPAKDVRAYVGITKRSDANFYNEYRVSKVIIHPLYEDFTNDIALLKLSRKLEFNQAVRPICLPNAEVTPKDTTCYTMGWGVTDNYQQTASDHLMEISIMNLDMNVCRGAYTTYERVTKFVQTNNKIMCAGLLDRQVDSCLGDSGGPLVCQRCQSCDWYLAGITSFGPKKCGTKGVPGIYSKVASFEKWIRFHTKMVPSPTRSNCPNKIGP